MKSKKITSSISQDDTRKAIQEIKLLFAKPEFQEEIRKLRIKWGVDANNPDRETNAKRLELSRVGLPRKTVKGFVMGDYPKAKQSYIDLVDLMKRFNLDSQYWVVVLWEYVRTEKFDKETLDFNLLYLNSKPIIRYETQSVTNKTKIIIELGDSTTLKDVRVAWRDVEKMRKQLHLLKPKFKEWKNFERDQRAYQLASQCKTIGEIDKILQEEYAADLDYGNIKKIVSTFRKKLGLPKGGKLITSRIKRLR